MLLLPQRWIDSIQISPKNLRLSAILISIYEIVSSKSFSLVDRLSNNFD